MTSGESSVNLCISVWSYIDPKQELIKHSYASSTDVLWRKLFGIQNPLRKYYENPWWCELAAVRSMWKSPFQAMEKGWRVRSNSYALDPSFWDGLSTKIDNSHESKPFPSSLAFILPRRWRSSCALQMPTHHVTLKYHLQQSWLEATREIPTYFVPYIHNGNSTVSLHYHRIAIRIYSLMLDRTQVGNLISFGTRIVSLAEWKHVSCTEHRF